MPAYYVECAVEEGLRPSEATVGVPDVDGRVEYLRVERTFVRRIEGRDCLPIGMVYRERKPDGSELVLIELPHEADSGANRLWVAGRHIHQLESRQERAHDPVRSGNPSGVG